MRSIGGDRLSQKPPPCLGPLFRQGILLMLWVGIDEAGYGPNLGPLVMTAVFAEGPPGPRPDLWRDFADVVDRAGGDPSRVWIDDSKRVHSASKGPARVEASALWAVGAVSPVPPPAVSSLLSIVGAGTLDSTEWRRWLPVEHDPPLPRFNGSHPPRSQDPADLRWRLVAIHSVVLGPETFNLGLRSVNSKATVHFSAFATLLERVWSALGSGETACVRGDKHGGRNFYGGPLSAAFPDAWVDRGEEGASASRYSLRMAGRRIDLELRPRADSDDGLVALASLISKYLRESWMADFNAFWCSRLPDLSPTAGYPTDARRWRLAIESLSEELDLPPVLWWREK